jgi:hypothetical protein
VLVLVATIVARTAGSGLFFFIVVFVVRGQKLVGGLGSGPEGVGNDPDGQDEASVLSDFSGLAGGILVTMLHDFFSWGKEIGGMPSLIFYSVLHKHAEVNYRFKSKLVTCVFERVIISLLKAITRCS